MPLREAKVWRTKSTYLRVWGADLGVGLPSIITRQATVLQHGVIVKLHHVSSCATAASCIILLLSSLLPIYLGTHPWIWDAGRLPSHATRCCRSVGSEKMLSRSLWAQVSKPVVMSDKGSPSLICFSPWLMITCQPLLI